MVSFRGAIRIAGRLPLPPQGDTPCQSCADQPCSSACPVGALRPNAYDTDACHSHLDSIARQACMSQGCAARRACPVSATYGRVSEQSAFHMRAFHKP